MNIERLKKQVDFIVEIDKLKSIYRRALLIDGSKNENDAEHSWHLAVMAMIFLEHANDEKVNILRVIKMLIIHDIVEIDAGDFSAYDESARNQKLQKETSAANRLFGILPTDQRDELINLWKEFEEGKTSDSKFAVSLDRLSPILLNYYTEGYTWKKHGITLEMVLERNKHIKDGSKSIWDFAKLLIFEAVEKGYLPNG